MLFNSFEIYCLLQTSKSICKLNLRWINCLPNATKLTGQNTCYVSHQDFSNSYGIVQCFIVFFFQWEFILKCMHRMKSG